MVYGEKYSAYQAEQVLQTVKELSEKYEVSHFAFNDEAIPPKIANQIGRIFPSYTDSGWTFTGLIKFEKYYKKEDWDSLYRIGFRSLYVGLESGSERVLRLMKKNNKKETMVTNLREATNAGIWMHTFLFFGFPGETHTDAQETYDFVLSNFDIIGSIGCGTFSLEHNAPIFHHLEDFGVEIEPNRRNDIDVYYNYQVTDGITSKEAKEWFDKLTSAVAKIPKYFAATWVPREHLLVLLSQMSPQELVETSKTIRNKDLLRDHATVPNLFSILRTSDDLQNIVVINRLNMQTLSVKRAAASLFLLMNEHDQKIRVVEHYLPRLVDSLLQADLSSFDSADIGVG